MAAMSPGGRSSAVRRTLLRRVVRGAAVALLAAAPTGSLADGGASPDAEVYTSPVTGAAYRVSGSGDDKALVGPDGASYASVGEILAAEEEALPRERRLLDPALLALARGPGAASALVPATIRFVNQPAHEASRAALARVRPLLDAATARVRAVLARIDPLLPEPGVRAGLSVRSQMEEEDRLLRDEERATLAGARLEIRSLLEGVRAEVLAAAAAGAAPDRAALRAWVAGVPGAGYLAESSTLSTATILVPASRLLDLLDGVPGIARVSPVGRCVATTGTATATIGAASWWNAGYLGSLGSRVGVLDTGVDALHPALKSSVADAGVFIAYGAAHDPSFNDNAKDADDHNGHGTHVSGIVASTDANFPGVVPSGFVVNAKCGYDTFGGLGSLQDPDIFDAGDWAAGKGAAVFNGSFGDVGSSGDSAVTHFFDAVVDTLLIPVAIAAGNDGPSSGTVGAPGDLYNGFSVASLNDRGTAAQADNILSGFSSRGPTADGRRKPDLAAPGENVTSANAFWEGGSPDFVTESGTSMASPMVAGSLSLLLDYSGSWSPAETKALLLNTVRNTAPVPTSPDNAWGYGALDLGAAYAARATPATGTFTSAGPTYLLFRAGSLPLGGRATLAWNRQVVYAGSRGPTAHPALLDLDLEVYDESTGAARGSSTSSLDSVEQVKASQAVASPILKVIRRGNFPSSFSSQEFAVATAATTGTSAVTPPWLTETLDSPVAVAAGTDFAVTLHLHNGGQAAAAAPSAALTVPAGFVLSAGANPRSLASLAGGAEVAVSWTLHAPSAAASGTVSATSSSSSYGLAFDGGTASGVVRVDDAAPSAPTGLSAAALDAATVRLDWVDTSAIETGFEVSRSMDGGAAAPVATPAVNATSWTDTGLQAAHLYAYTVRALGVIGPSAPAGPVSVQTQPTLVLATVKGTLTDRARARKDALKVSGSFQFSGSPDGTFTLPGEPVNVRVGDPASPWVLDIPVNAPGWSGTGGHRRWRSPKATLPRVVLDLNTVRGTFSVVASGLDLATPLPATIEVLLRVGNDAGSQQTSWHAGRPGLLKYP